MQNPPSLTPEAGALNTIVAEAPVRDADDVTTKGKATLLAAAHLARDVGAALLSMSMEHKGTLEFQLTVEKERNALEGLTVHKWRVDVWKARQRQYLRVKVVKGELDLSGREKSDTFPGKDCGAYRCAHCGKEDRIPPVFIGDLPRRKVVHCEGCSLPVFLQLVEAK